MFYRTSTQERAILAGVDGWVRNRRDGTVEAVFEGPAEAVEAMVAFCDQGPSWARVDRLEVSEESLEGIRGFRVR